MSKAKSFAYNFPKLAAGSAGILAALYFGLSPRLAPKIYHKRMFHPWPYPEGNGWDTTAIGGITKQDCYFRACDDSILHAWLFEKPDAEKVILFSHGNTGNLAGRFNYINRLLETGASVFIYDYRGYGKSEGIPSPQAICEDGVMAFDYLIREKGYKPSQVVLYGESLGTAVACEIAAERPSAGIILQSGFSSLRKIGAERMPISKLYPEFLFPKPFLDCAKRMEKDPRPLLVIHGGKDEVVPFAHAEEIHSRAAEPKQIVHLEDCNHSDMCSVAPERYVAAIREFIESL